MRGGNGKISKFLGGLVGIAGEGAPEGYLAGVSGLVQRPSSHVSSALRAYMDLEVIHFSLILFPLEKLLTVILLSHLSASCT